MAAFGVIAAVGTAGFAGGTGAGYLAGAIATAVL